MPGETIRTIYTTEFKNWEFGKAGAQNFRQAHCAVAEAVPLLIAGAMQADEKAGMPAQPKTNS
jgi:hypothetical protein